MINANQHCTAEDCYTFSHTAAWCGSPQPHKCDCAYCKKARHLIKESQHAK